MHRLLDMFPNNVMIVPPLWSYNVRSIHNPIDSLCTEISWVQLFLISTWLPLECAINDWSCGGVPAKTDTMEDWQLHRRHFTMKPDPNPDTFGNHHRNYKIIYV